MKPIVAGDLVLGYLPDFHIALNATDVILSKAREIEDYLEDQYKSSNRSPTTIMNGIRCATMVREIACLGLFSRFEGHLKTLRPDWKNPVVEIEAELAKKGHASLAKKIQVLRKANNAIKHGTGESADWLRKRKNELWFSVCEGLEDFDEADELSMTNSYVDVTDDYYKEMKNILEKSLQVIPELGVWQNT